MSSAKDNIDRMSSSILQESNQKDEQMMLTDGM